MLRAPSSKRQDLIPLTPCLPSHPTRTVVAVLEPRTPPTKSYSRQTAVLKQVEKPDSQPIAGNTAFLISQPPGKDVVVTL